MKKFFIVSGISGAGKSQTLKVFEDFGYVCIDNMPMQMITDFLSLCLKKPDKYNKVVISIDARAGRSLDSFQNIISYVNSKKINYKVIFLNASDEVLIRRYSETRRKHPLGNTVIEGIKLERKLLENVFHSCDEVIDTSDMTNAKLKETLSKISGDNINPKDTLTVSVMSFGYKYGIPTDADIIFDVRFLANPNYVRELKFKTGEDKPVQDYILNQQEFKTFFDSFSKLMENTLPGYIKEGKSYLTIAIGCTGGRHRSVFTAKKLMEFLKKKKYKVSLKHRDVSCDKK